MQLYNELDSSGRKVIIWVVSALVLLPAVVQPVLAQSPQVSLTGAENGLRSNILSSLRITGEPCDTPFPRLQRLLPQVRSSVQEAARALGYYHSSFSTVFERDEQCWSLNIEIEPGEPLLLDMVTIRVTGGDEISGVFDEAIEDSGLVPGERLNQGVYERLKNRLAALAVENGFFAARFIQSEIQLDLVSNQADILIEFEPGQRYIFGGISIMSGGVLSEDFIRGMVPFSSGDYYASESLVELRQNLDDSQYFRQISINPQLAQVSNQAVPVGISLAARPRHAYSGGIGFTTDTGPRIRLGYEDRYLNRRGHRLNSDATLSTVRSQANLGYTLPLRNPARENLIFSGGYITEDNDTFESERFKLETSYNFESPGGWLRTAFVNHEQDDYVINAEEDKTILTMLGMNLSRTMADDLINPSSGWRLFGQVRGAADSFISDVTFLQLYGSGKSVLSVGERGRFITRLEAGSTWVDNLEDLPVSVRFFAGGDQSVRGYKYESLGPVNELDEVIGGKHLLVASMEYDFQFRDNWRLAVFVDTGNAFSDPENFDWKQSAGIGLRWQTPIGPLRADIAHGFQGEQSVRLHITMGPDL